MRRTRRERERGDAPLLRPAPEAEFIHVEGEKEVGVARPENIDRDFSTGLSD